MRLTCPNCTTHSTIDPSLQGKRVKCPKCEAVFIVPSAPAEGTALAPPIVTKQKPVSATPPVPPAATVSQSQPAAPFSFLAGIQRSATSRRRKAISPAVAVLGTLGGLAIVFSLCCGGLLMLSASFRDQPSQSEVSKSALPKTDRDSHGHFAEAGFLGEKHWLNRFEDIPSAIQEAIQNGDEVWYLQHSAPLQDDNNSRTLTEIADYFIGFDRSTLAITQVVTRKHKQQEIPGKGIKAFNWFEVDYRGANPFTDKIKNDGGKILFDVTKTWVVDLSDRASITVSEETVTVTYLDKPTPDGRSELKNSRRKTFLIKNGEWKLTLDADKPTALDLAKQPETGKAMRLEAGNQTTVAGPSDATVSKGKVSRGTIPLSMAAFRGQVLGKTFSKSEFFQKYGNPKREVVGSLERQDPVQLHYECADGSILVEAHYGLYLYGDQVSVDSIKST